MLVADRGNLPGSDAHRPLEHRAGIIDDQQIAAGCTTDRLGAEAPHVRRRRSHPKHGIADRELHDDVVALSDAMQDSRTERRFVEVDRRARSIDPQLRLDAGHGC